MILIFSDVHGNLPAFELMLKKEKNIKEYICLGDLVNYGPWSNECVDLAVSIPNITLLMGNHEEAFINGSYDGTNLLVIKFFNHTFPNFSRQSNIKQFEQSLTKYNYIFTHTIQNKYIYPNTKIVFNNNYIIGHSHCQFMLKSSGFSLFNPGSVGQNRSEINRIDYMLLDLEKNEFIFKYIYYSPEVIINEMKLRKYPNECLAYYQNKIK